MNKKKTVNWFIGDSFQIYINLNNLRSGNSDNFRSNVIELLSRLEDSFNELDLGVIEFHAKSHSDLGQELNSGEVNVFQKVGK